jgi:DUF2934 family protein
MTTAHRLAIVRELTQQVAYHLWLTRGRPVGSPEVDWFRAETLMDRVQSIWSLETDRSVCHEVTGSAVNVDAPRAFDQPHREGVLV